MNKHVQVEVMKQKSWEQFTLEMEGVFTQTELTEGRWKRVVTEL